MYGMIIWTILMCFSMGLFFGAASTNADEYIQVPGLIDLRTTFSDGKLSPEALAELARDREFGAVIINDHDRLAMEYGLFPLRNVIKKKRERPSINMAGAGKYLAEIRRVRSRYPDLVVIPGSETAPFYYWTGSYFKGNLTAHNHEKRILTIGLEKPTDYENLPILHNGFSTRFAHELLPGMILCAIPFLIGLLFLKGQRKSRILGLLICA